MTSAASPRGIRGSASRPDDHVIVLFGATGDLARRKLLPGLFHLSVAGLLPDNYRIIGSARRTLTDEQFREHARQSVTECGISKPAGGAWGAFERALSFRAANGLEGYERLILDAMLGDQALFTRADGVERLWEISAPLLDNPPPVELYAPGSWGPEPSLRRLAAPFGWHLPDAGGAAPDMRPPGHEPTPQQLCPPSAVEDPLIGAIT